MNRAIVTIKNENFWAENDIICVRQNHCATLFRVGVLREAAEEQHSVVSALTFEMSLDECNTVNRELRKRGVGGIISFHVADGEGEGDAMTGLDGEFDLFNVAAAIGAIKASCGWDECSNMRIRVNGDEVAILISFENGAWVVTAM